LNHVIDWDHAKVIERESNRMDRWIREAIHIRKEQDKLMNRDEGSYQLPHVYDYLLSATVDSRFDEGSSGCLNVNKNSELQRLYFDKFGNLLKIIMSGVVMKQTQKLGTCMFLLGKPH